MYTSSSKRFGARIVLERVAIGLLGSTANSGALFDNSTSGVLFFGFLADDWRSLKSCCLACLVSLRCCLTSFRTSLAACRCFQSLARSKRTFAVVAFRQDCCSCRSYIALNLEALLASSAVFLSIANCINLVTFKGLYPCAAVVNCLPNSATNRRPLKRFFCLETSDL